MSQAPLGSWAMSGSGTYMWALAGCPAQCIIWRQAPHRASEEDRNKAVSISIWGHMIPVHLHAKKISSLLSISEHHRDMWSRPWEILSDKFNCIWHKAIALFTCHFSGLLPNPRMKQESLNTNGWSCPQNSEEAPTEQVGKEMEAQDGKEDGRGEGIPRILPHHLYHYLFPTGIPNNSPLSTRIFSPDSLVPLSCPHTQRQTQKHSTFSTRRNHSTKLINWHPEGTNMALQRWFAWSGFGSSSIIPLLPQVVSLLTCPTLFHHVTHPKALEWVTRL